MLVPMVFCCVFMTIMGGNAIYFDMQDVTELAAALEENVSDTLFALLGQLPLTEVTSLAAVALLAIFFITSADASTFVCVSMTQKVFRILRPS